MAKKTLAIVGVGLMGGSIGLAVKKLKLPYKVLGIGRNTKRLLKAKKLRAIDDFSTDIKKIQTADLIILCMTIEEIVPSFKHLAPYLKNGAVVTDIGSVKNPIVESISQHVASAYFIGGHPMAGSEKTGVENSKADLYQKATVALCPSSSTKNSSTQTVIRFWKSLRASPIVVEPQIHDILVAQTSHLPHVLSAAFVHLISGLNRRDPNTSKLLAGSFKDLTRITDADAHQWAEISSSNQKFLIGALKSYRDILLSILKKFENSNAAIPEWQDFFDTARTSRKKLL